MAVDIKQLRIGAHVEVNGEMCEIDSIGGGLQIGCINTTTWVGVDAGEDWVNPIRITPELLVELGFEKDGDTFTKREKTENNNILSRTYIGVTMIGGMHFRVEACDAVTVCGNMIVSYLHELENFIYLTLGKELIEE